MTQDVQFRLTYLGFTCLLSFVQKLKKAAEKPSTSMLTYLGHVSAQILE